MKTRTVTVQPGSKYERTLKGKYELTDGGLRVSVDGVPGIVEMRVTDTPPKRRHAVIRKGDAVTYVSGDGARKAHRLYAREILSPRKGA